MRRVRVLLAALLLCGCSIEPGEVVLASTTSTMDSGLLDALVPAFEQSAGGARVKVIAVGSGEALTLGRRGDADVLLVHSLAEEIAFMENGHGVRRLPLMYNDYVILGPPADDAHVYDSRDVVDALTRIAASGSRFISRGDSSGTHRKELRLWQSAGIDVNRDWHNDVGQGMAETLMIASERAAYTLSDRATYLASEPALQLIILREGDPELLNPYSVITTRSSRNPAGAQRFADWITGAEGVELIRTFGVSTHGRPLFFPTPDSAQR